jgi:hypothetical protein
MTKIDENERVKFEAAYLAHFNAHTGSNKDAAYMVSLRDGDGYGEARTYLNNLWEGWKMHVALDALQEDKDQPIKTISLEVALDFADNPRPYHSLQCPADTNGELYRARAVLAAEYRKLQPYGVVVCHKRIPNAKQDFIAARFYRENDWGDDYSKVPVYAIQPRQS